MVKDDSGDDDRKSKHFDGSDPGSYATWKRRSTLYLLGLPTTVGAQKHGPKLIGLLRGAAEEEVLDKIMSDPNKKRDLVKEDGDTG